MPAALLHVAGLAEGAHARLGGALVLAHLQADLSISQQPLLVLVPVPLALVSHLGSKGWPFVLRVLLGLWRARDS